MFKRILLGTDFTPASRHAEEQVRQLARTLRASVVVLHAIEPIDPGDEDNPFADFYEQLRLTAEAKMTELSARFAEAEIPCTTHVTLGHRWSELIELADAQGADLIVLGGHPAGSPRNLGSTGIKVFLGSHLPVLVLRSERPQGSARRAEP